MVIGLKQKERINSLDCIRVVAVLAVVMIHVSASFVVNNQGNPWIFFIGNIFDAISIKIYIKYNYFIFDLVYVLFNSGKYYYTAYRETTY